MDNTVMQAISKLSDITITDIKLNSSFEKLGINDLELVELIMALEDKLDFRANEEMYEVKTIEELITQIDICMNK